MQQLHIQQIATTVTAAINAHVGERKPDGAMYHKWSTDGGTTWSGWQNLGGELTSSPAAISWSYPRIDVFVRGSDGALWQKYYWNGWSGWKSLGGQLTPNTATAVSSWAAGRLDLFVEDTDNALYRKY
jgi:hypothetical protein